MKNIYVLIIAFAILGLIVGYLLFGKMGGEYISIDTIFSTSGGSIGSGLRKATGLHGIRQNILISGGVGAIIGVLFFYVRKKK
jgi:hypothetical protein